MNVGGFAERGSKAQTLGAATVDASASERATIDCGSVSGDRHWSTQGPKHERLSGLQSRMSLPPRLKPQLSASNVGAIRPTYSCFIQTNMYANKEIAMT